MLARVEGMPLETLKAGVPWNWDSFGSYLARLEGILHVPFGVLLSHAEPAGFDRPQRSASRLRVVTRIRFPAMQTT